MIRPNLASENAILRHKLKAAEAVLQTHFDRTSFSSQTVADCVRAARKYRRENPDDKGPQAEVRLIINILEAAGLEAEAAPESVIP